MTHVDPERLEEIADLIGLDEFERIAVADLIREIGPPNALDTPERDLLFIRLGAIVNEKMEKWAIE